MIHPRPLVAVGARPQARPGWPASFAGDGVATEDEAGISPPRAGIRVGIDASNIRAGGGVTHLVEVLRWVRPEEHGVVSVVVWGGRETLARIAPRPWLELSHQPALDGSLAERVAWKNAYLTALARRACDVLLVPGGTYLGAFRPFVALSQNLLPFEHAERARYGRSWMHAKLALLEKTQTATFRRAEATIFMCETNRRVVEAHTGPLPAPTAVVPHGISPRFRAAPRPQEPLSAYSIERPFRWLYVSTVDVYKHPWHLARAVALLRGQGVPVELEIVGPAAPRGLARLSAELAELDPGGAFIHYRGALPYEELPEAYRRADGFAHASSCESFGQTVVEAMAAGIPVACSRRSAMPELLQECGVYFDPERPDDIAQTLHALLLDRELRERNVRAASRRAADFCWERCARDTFAVIAEAHARAVRAHGSVRSAISATTPSSFASPSVSPITDAFRTPGSWASRAEAFARWFPGFARAEARRGRAPG